MANEVVVNPNPVVNQNENPNPAVTPNTAPGPIPAGNEIKPKETVFTSKEDRSTWIPPHRLTEESGKRTKLETEMTSLRAQYEQAQKRIQALAGVAPKSEDEAEIEQVRDAFRRVRPDLAKLDDAKIDRLLQLADRAEALEQSATHYWETHGRGMLAKVEAAIAKEIGGDLNDEQKEELAMLYTLRAEKDPEFLKRHNAGDEKLVEEVAARFTKNWVEPVRRRTTSLELSRQRRVPSGGNTQQVATAKPKINFADEKAVEDAAVARFGELGGSFGG